MSDQALENASRRRNEAMKRFSEAKEKLAEAQAAVSVARAELDKIDAFIALWHEYAETVYDVQASVPTVGRFTIEDNVPVPTRSKRTRGNPKKEDVAKAAREIIAAAGQPLPRAVLFTNVKERGFSINGTDPEMVFSTMLWRVPKAVVRLPEFGYWLTDLPFEPAGYDPHAASRNVDVEDLKMALADAAGQLPQTEDADEDGSDGSESSYLGENAASAEIRPKDEIFS